MRIALIGNTCNNNFAFLRYLLDLGIETHLFLYSNEGKKDSNPIHSPSWDSFSSHLFQNHISYLDIPNGLHAINPDNLTSSLKSFSEAIQIRHMCRIRLTRQFLNV